VFFSAGQAITGSTVLSTDPAVPMNFVHTPTANANFIFQPFPDRVSQAGAAFTPPGFMHDVDDHYLTTYRDTCQQQENYQYYQAGAYAAFPASDSAAGLQYSLEGHQLPGWGTDAAGLPIAPLTVHQDELLAAANGNIDAIQHAARLTLAKTSIATGKLIWPAQALWAGVSQNNFCQGPNTQNSVWTITGNGNTTVATTSGNEFRPAWPAGMTVTIDNVNYTVISVAANGLSMVVSANIGPGSHSMTTPDTNCPPYGTRFRLKANFQWPGYLSNCDTRCQNVVQAIIRQQQRYGVILSDIGNAWGFDADGGFTTASIGNAAEQLSCTIAGGCGFQGLIGNSTNYEIVDESSLQTSQTQATPALNWVEAKLGNPYLTPQDGAVVKVTDSANSTAYYSVALQGVGIGVNHPNEVVMAGASPFQIPVWVTGTSNAAYSCSLSPSGGPYGTISSGCLYTPPSTAAVSTLANATVTITANADSTATRNVYIQVVPVSSDGSLRISLGKTGPIPSYTDNTGAVWWNDMTDGLPINLFPDGSSVSGPIYEPTFTDYPGSSYFATAPLVYQSTWFAAYNDLHFRIHVPNGHVTGTVLPINSAAPSADVAAFSFDCNGNPVLGQTDLYTFTGGTYIARPLTCSQTVSDGLLHMVMRIQGVAYGPHTLCSGSCYVPSYEGAANIVAGLIVNPS
jgi:hypothetical protein